MNVREDGTVYLDMLIVRRDEVLSTLQRLRAKESARPIAVRADETVQYGEVAAVLGACREAGWEEVALVSVEPQG